MSEKEELERRLFVLHKRLKGLLYCREADVKTRLRSMIFELEAPQKRIKSPRPKPSRHVEP